MKSSCGNALPIALQGPTPNWYTRLLQTLNRWRSNVHNRRILAQLDARLLRDCGISETERQAELSKPFWR
ncbi:DUF1127 domain-containing protein (plasmid) [Pseudomonas sp. Leaf58]|uniref:DUF1127 domain-containing protein n=1 Tax=Pseudomonas sp. Leaf58 TaxID=1736226 RepID=UPI0009E67873|nr:DUF1127 domain-containing protein [Pseudomonas sp. Leaf58]AYG48042.1 DUF1127 domain-containing protein [Pseudomonas sp. Leaf58]